MGYAPPEADHVTPAAAEAFFADLTAAAARAEALAGGPRCASFRLAGRVIRLQAAGPAMLEPLEPAIAHRRVSGEDPPDLTVRLVDTASTSVPPPPPGWRWDQHLPRGQVPGFERGPVRLAHEAAWGGLSALDESSATAVLWVRDTAALPGWERAAPLRTILHWWLPRRRTRLVHAAAVGLPGGAALVVGPGGSGKSTTALTCLEAGLRYLGDDYVAVTEHARGWAVHNLYATAKLAPGDVSARFPQLGPLRWAASSGDKHTVLLDRDRLAQIPAVLPLHLVVFPAVRPDGPTAIRPLSPAHALRAVAPSTIFQQPGDEPEAFAFLTRLVRSLPTVALELGRDLAEIPEVLARELASLEEAQ